MSDLGRPEITSPSNPQVKRLLRLRRRRHRDREGLFLIEGYREILRALGAKVPITEIYVCEDLFLGDNETRLVERLTNTGAELHRLSAVPFRRVAYRDRPEGLLALARQFDSHLDRLEVGTDPLFLVVEGIEKPGNLGSMLRTADAAGVDGVIVADPTTDPFNPNVVRASLGSLFNVPLAVATTHNTLRWLSRNGIMPLVSRPTATASLWEADLSGAVAVVVGSEQYGLSRPWLAPEFPSVSIPMHGSADSLNAAVAAAVLLFEANRQRS